MNQKLKKAILLSAFGAAGFLGGLVLWQKACFWRAQKNTEEALFEIYASPFGDITYTSAGGGQPVLLLHSMLPGTSSEEWALVTTALAEHFHVYAIDLPGFGNSFSPKKPWTAYQYAQCLHSFIEQIIGRSTFVLGSNGGADLALITALLHPEKIKGLQLISPEGFSHGYASNAQTKPLHTLLLPLVGTQQYLMETTKYKIKQNLEDAFFAKEKITQELIDALHYGARKDPMKQATFAAIKTGFWRADTRQALTKLTVPFQVFWGEENKTNPIAAMAWAEEARPDGDYVIFEGVGSYPHWENSQAFIQVMKEYLN